MSKMTIIQSRFTVSTLRIKYGRDVYLRKVYNNGDIIWTPISYDGEEEDETGELEKEYQKLINKPVTTTNEQPKFTDEELAVLVCYLKKLPRGGCCGGESGDCTGKDVLTETLRKVRLIV